MAEQQEKKKISKAWRIFAWIFAFIVLLTAINSWKNWTTTSSTRTPVQKVDVVQQRIDRINELYAEESTFEKVEKIWDNDLAIVFSDTPDIWVQDSIDSITRWQAVNLSKEVNGVATVKTYVWWEAQMFCIATKWTINECSDYR